MHTEFVAFAPEHLEAVREFSAAAWRRPRSASYLHWRYLEPRFHRAYLALREGRCLAWLTAFRRPYQADDEVVTISDSFDWYCLPELRRSGLGVRLMQRMLRDPEPVVVTGGTPDTRDLLPRMGFRSLDLVRNYVLPLGAERMAGALARRGVPRGASRPVFAALKAWFRPRRRAVPRGGRVTATASVGPEALCIDPRPAGRGSAPIWTAEFLRWLMAGFPAMGHYVPLYFAVGESLIGWALLRICATEAGADAALLDVRAREPDPDLYTWMISEVAVRAAGFAPGYLTAGTTCVAVEEGLRRNRFRPSGTAPIHFGPNERKGLPEPILFGAHWGDEPLVPYPTSWWDDPPRDPDER